MSTNSVVFAQAGAISHEDVLKLHRRGILVVVVNGGIDRISFMPRAGDSFASTLATLGVLNYSPQGEVAVDDGRWPEDAVNEIDRLNRLVKYLIENAEEYRRANIKLQAAMEIKDRAKEAGK